MLCDQECENLLRDLEAAESPAEITAATAEVLKSAFNHLVDMNLEMASRQKEELREPWSAEQILEIFHNVVVTKYPNLVPCLDRARTGGFPRVTLAIGSSDDLPGLTENEAEYYRQAVGVSFHVQTTAISFGSANLLKVESSWSPSERRESLRLVEARIGVLLAQFNDHAKRDGHGQDLLGTLK